MAGLKQGHVLMTDQGLEETYRDKGDTWPKVLKWNREKYGDNHIAMRYKHYGIWQRFTWNEYYRDTCHLALGLLSLGFKAGDRVLIIGDNAPQWYTAELAAHANHGISVGLYSDLTPGEIRYIAENSGVSFAIVEDQEQVDKFLQIKDKLPDLKKVIYWRQKGLSHYNDSILMGYRRVLELGEQYEKEHSTLFESNIASGQADDICAIIYTSGTTGTNPKGAVHTYRTMMPAAYYLLQLDPWTERDNVVSSLPPAWITEQWLGIGCHLLSASILDFAEEAETQAQDIREIGPDIVLYGARLWESQAGAVQMRILGSDPIKKLCYHLFMPVGYKIAGFEFNQKKPGILWKFVNALANYLLFRPIKDSLGLAKARICYTTGSTVSPDVIRFYHALGVPLKTLYGSAEGGVLTGAKSGDIGLETICTLQQGAEAKLTAEGEIICRQPGLFIGYHDDPVSTAGALKEGWFHTGDKGFFRDDGRIILEDRLNDLIKLPGGIAIAPQMIESRLKFSPYIKDAWVTAGPRGAYISAIIIIDFDNVGRWADRKGVTYTTFSDLAQKSEVYELIRQDIARVNRELPPDSRVRKYVNLHKEFDPDESELTRNRKLRRAFLTERYDDLIGSIYEGRTEISIQTQVKYRDGRTGTMKTTLNIRAVEEADV
jgi:long-chain acyl-CoA synthetase